MDEIADLALKEESLLQRNLGIQGKRKQRGKKKMGKRGETEKRNLYACQALAEGLES